ncbi:MAG: hypothetical protein EHM24_08535, partial [Acidobacteria bacterium]
MRNLLANTLMAGLLISLPALSLAAIPAASWAKMQAPAHSSTAAAAKPAPSPAPAKSGHKAESKAEVANHSTSGVVKSITDSRLVITRKSQNKATAMTFTLNPSTAREGKLQVGSNVSVR